MNPTAQPETKKSQIIEKLNKLITDKDADQFTLKKLKYEANKLKEHDLAGAFSILGMIACVEKDHEKLHTYHKNALSYSNESFKYLSDYVVSLNNCKLYQDARIYALKAHEKDPSDLKVLDVLIRALNELNLEDEFQKYVKKWFNLKGQPHLLITFPEDDDVQLSKILKCFNELLDNHPELISKPGLELIKRVDDLVEGVEI